ncbi:GNAT family N-acetyltransferase [Kribbella sp. NPDC000426]|uniref:GNAT family N-acetyltransferase n=1 Tax=Kribbella sp. NPDC000426 TaxID=3154255 RepID=UPI0033248907
MSDGTVAGLSKVAWDAAVDGWRQLAQLPSAAGVFTWEQIGGADCFWWVGPPGAMAHQIFLTTTDDQTLDRALASPNRGVGSSVVVRSLDKLALGRFEPENVGTGLFMTCDLTEARTPISPGPFRTTIITTPAQQADLLAMVGGVYRDVGGLTAFFQGFGASQIIGVYDQDRLIASATVVRSGLTANIWSVATAATDRGRGAATTAVSAALDHATKSGCTTATLSTSNNLAQWYQHLHFKPAGHEHTATLRALAK